MAVFIQSKTDNAIAAVIYTLLDLFILVLVIYLLWYIFNRVLPIHAAASGGTVGAGVNAGGIGASAGAGITAGRNSGFNNTNLGFNNLGYACVDPSTCRPDQKYDGCQCQDMTTAKIRVY